MRAVLAVSGGHRLPRGLAGLRVFVVGLLAARGGEELDVADHLPVAASGSAIASLARSRVENKGFVVAIAPGEGAARGQWVIVTQEQTTGTGAYTGLPPTLHVTFARVTHVGQRWTVKEWNPRT